MMTGIIVFVVFLCIAAVILLIAGIGIYNQLVGVKVNVDKAWANIDVLLKQRYDEIPKLVQVCEGYMKYEQDTLKKIVQARSQYLEAKSPGQAAAADSVMGGALKSLFALSENYPDLKANVNFKQLQERVSYLESQIADRREFYNDSVGIFNTRIQQIPYNFVAGFLNYGPREMFKAAEGEKASGEIKFNMPA